jgi:REP element-mobilizing transposase RayT
MSRPLRCIQPGAVYHLISRFVAKEWFIESDEERALYLKLIGDHAVESDWRFFAFATMSNHLHFGAVAGHAPLASVFRPVHTLFAESINRSRERIGAVFARGPKAIPVAEGGVARLIGYIHCNPVRAGIVDDPSRSTWTSHRSYLGLDAPPTWLDTKLGLELAGFQHATELDEWIAITASRGELAVAHLDAATKPGRPKRRNPPEQEAGFFRSGGRHVPAATTVPLPIVFSA